MGLKIAVEMGALEGSENRHPANVRPDFRESLYA